MNDKIQHQQIRDHRQQRQPSVPVTGVWLRNVGDKIEVLVETAGEWRVVIDGYRLGERKQQISHIVEPAGILKGPVWR